MSSPSASRFAGIAVKVAHAVTDFVRFTFEGPARKYRPEQHYMRGPGPKWREKHMLDGAGSA
jgi:hypothetical protein